MSERKELNEDLLNDVNGGLSANEVLDNVKKVAGRYVDDRLGAAKKVKLGILGEADLTEAIGTVGKALEATEIKGLKDVGSMITKNVNKE